MLGFDVHLRQPAPDLGGTDEMLRQASNVASSKGASSPCSQVEARRLGRVHGRLFGRSILDDRFLWREIAGYVLGLLYLRTRRG